MKLYSAFTILLFIHFTLILKAQDSPKFSHGTISTTASTAALPITASGFSNIASGNLKILYDPAVAFPAAVLKGPDLTGTLDYNISEPGVIRIGWFTFPAVTLPDGLVIFTIEFNKVSAGTSAISFDGTVSDMDCQFYNGSHIKLNDVPFGTFFLSGSLTFNGNTAPVTTVPDLTAVVNEGLVVPVTVTGFTKVGAVSLILNYDPAVLEFKSAENTGGFPGMILYNHLAGTITVSGTTNEPDGFSLPDGTIFFTVNFTYLGGTTCLTWADEDRSCEYAGPQSAFVYPDMPQSEYYINGMIRQCPAPDSPAVNLVHPTCDAPAGTIEIISPAGAEYTYSIDGLNYQSSPTFSGLNAGNYNVTVKNSMGCVSPYASAVIEEQPLTPVRPAVEVIVATCNSQGSASITNFNETNTYTFSPAGPVAGTGGIISGFISGQSYTVKAVSSAGCESAASVSFIMEDAGTVPEQPAVEVVAATCNAPGNASITNFDPTYTYTFSPSGPVAGTGGNINGFITGQSYTVKAVSSDGCESAASLPFITEDAGTAPDRPVVEVVAATCDAPGNASITNFDPTYTYTFSPSGPVADTGGNINGFITGQSYTVKAVSSDGCESAASLPFITEDAGTVPEQPAVEVTAATCNAPGSASITNYNPIYTYTFSPEGTVAGTGGIITGFISGQSYTVKAVSSDGCESTASAPFIIEDAGTVPEQPAVEVVAATCNAPGSASITNYNPIYTYTFSPEGPVAGTGGIITGFISGQSYTVKAVKSNGCESIASEPFTIEEILKAPEPIITMNGPAESCEPGCVILTASEGESYLWSTGETTQSIAVTTTGEYTVEVTYNNGCSATSSPIPIIILPAIQIKAANKCEISVYPNPFSKRLSIDFVSPETTHACVEIYDMYGRNIKNIFNRNVLGGVVYKTYFTPENLIHNVYIYRLTIGNTIHNGKVVYIKE